MPPKKAPKRKRKRPGPKKPRKRTGPKRTGEHFAAAPFEMAKTDVSSLPYVADGTTANFAFFHEKTLGAAGAAIAATLAASCELDYQKMVALFGGIVPNGVPFKVSVAAKVPGAMHYGCSDTEIYVGPIAGAPATSEGYPLLVVAEVVEVFEATINIGWNCGYSNGEGLSRVLACAFHPAGEIPGMVTAGKWLYDRSPVSGNRFNWVDTTNSTDTDNFSNGCSVLFLNWLNTVKSYGWDRIVAAGATTLGGVYANLTGGATDGWATFKAFIDTTFPLAKPVKITSDNPFRLKSPGTP